MDNTNKAPDFQGIFLKVKGEMPRKISVKAKNFFKEGFAKGGFTDASFQEWAKSSSPFTRKTMYNKGTLQNSIRSLQESKERVEVGTELEYAKIHNEGGTITVTPKMKKYWWAKYREFAGSVTRTKKGAVSAKGRKANAKAEYCKRMALMKVGSKIKIPKRQFIGESDTLMKQLNEQFVEGIETQLKED